jgi:hypothetical protein
VEEEGEEIKMPSLHTRMGGIALASSSSLSSSSSQLFKFQDR